MEFTNEINEALDKYFSILSHTGYKSYSQVYNLLIMVFIEEVLCGPMSEFITEEDYRIIHNSVDCIYGSCMIPFPLYKEGFTDKIIGVSYSCKLK